MDTVYALLTGYILSGKEDEARPIIQRALTEKDPGTSSTLFISILKTAIGNEDEEKVLAIFKTLSSLILSFPEYWALLQNQLEAAIENARAANKYDDLAIFLLQLGNAMRHLRKEFPDECAKAVGHWRECLTTVRDKVPLEDQEELEFVEKQALYYLSIAYFERAINAEGAQLEENEEKLQEIYKEDRLSSGVKYVLASLYTSQGQPGKARDLLRSEMVTAFNILFDDDIDNDWQGFIAIRNLLACTGDYENAQKASLMLPGQKFNAEVLKALFAEEDPSLNAAVATLVQFYETECPADKTVFSNLQTVLEETQRLSAAAESGSDEAAIYTKVLEILNQSGSLTSRSYSCNNCDREWDYEMGFHICKYCHGMDLCDVCYNDLQSDKTAKVLLCGKSHDWWVLEPWTMASYVRAWKKLILVKAEDGSEMLISPSKWLGTLCEQWGLTKSDWNFE